MQFNFNTLVLFLFVGLVAAREARVCSTARHSTLLTVTP